MQVESWTKSITNIIPRHHSATWIRKDEVPEMAQGRMKGHVGGVCKRLGYHSADGWSSALKCCGQPTRSGDERMFWRRWLDDFSWGEPWPRPRVRNKRPSCGPPAFLCFHYKVKSLCRPPLQSSDQSSFQRDCHLACRFGEVLSYFYPNTDNLIYYLFLWHIYWSQMQAHKSKFYAYISMYRNRVWVLCMLNTAGLLVLWSGQSTVCFFTYMSEIFPDIMYLSRFSKISTFIDRTHRKLNCIKLRHPQN